MTVLDQIRAENPSLELIPDDELIEKLLLEYKGDVDPDTFRESLTSQLPTEASTVAPFAPVAPEEGQPTAGRRPIGVGSAPD